MASKRKAAKPAGQKATKLKLPTADLFKLFKLLCAMNGQVPKDKAQAKKFELDGKLYSFTPSLRKTMIGWKATATPVEQEQLQRTLDAYFTGKGRNALTRSELLAKHGTFPKPVTIDRLGAVKVFSVGTWAYGSDSKGKTVNVHYHDDRIEIVKPKAS